MSRITKSDAMRGNMAESLARRTPPTEGYPASPQAKQFEGRRKLTGACEIDLDRIAPDPDQPRKEFDPEALAQLAASLKSVGQLTPIQVRWVDASGGYTIISGERRWRAAMAAGLPRLACVVAEGELTPDRLVEMQLMENACRKDLKPVEQGRAYKMLMEARGLSQRELAEVLSIHHTSITYALGLLGLPDSVQAQVDNGELPASSAYAIASKLEDPAAQEEIAHRVVAEKLSRAETVEAVRKATAPKPSRAGGARRSAAQKKEPAERSLKTTGGLKVVVSARKGFGVEAWAEALREAVRIVEAKLEPHDQAAA